MIPFTSEGTYSELVAAGRTFVFPGESSPTQGDRHTGSKAPGVAAGGLRATGSGEGASRRHC